MSRERLEELRARARYEELKSKATENPEEADLRAKAFAPLPDVREIEKSKIPAWQSALQGVASGMASNLDDEIAGLASGAKAAITFDNPVTAYEKTQSAVDAKKKLIREANELAGAGGNIAGSMVGPALLSGGAGLLKTMGAGAANSALSGAVNRAGDTTGADRVVKALDLGDIAKDAGLGGAFGAGGYAVGKGVQAIVSPRDQIIEPAVDYYKAAKKGLAEGAGIISSPVKALDRVLEVKANRAEAQALANDFRRHLGPGSSRNMSDKEILTTALLEPGDNQVKTWIARRAGIQLGTDSEAFGRILKETGDVTSEARKFNKFEAGKSIADDARGAYQGLKKDAGATYQELTSKARKQATSVDTGPIQDIDAIRQRIADDSTISGISKNYLNEALKILGDDFAEADPQTQFDRILAARRKLGGGAKFSAKNDVPEGAEAVKDAYNALNRYTRSLDDQASADKGYAGFKDLEKYLFKLMAQTSRGKIEDIDPIKTEALFTDTQNGRRLKEQIARLQKRMAAGELTKSQSEALKPLLEKFSRLSEKSNLKRDLDRFRYQGEVGVSGRVQEKIDSLTNKNTLLDDAQRNPELFIRRREAVDTMARDLYGKPFKDLTPDEKILLIRRLNKVKLESDGTLGGDVKVDRDAAWGK